MYKISVESLRGDLLFPINSSLLPNLYYSFFIIHKDNENLRFFPDIVSLISSTGINILKVGQSLFIGILHFYQVTL